MSDPIRSLRPISPSQSPLIPFNQATGKIGSIGAAAESAAPRALGLLRVAGRLSPWAVPAILVALTVDADEGEIATAGATWSAGMAARLDDGVKNLMPQILKTSESGWIAADQQEYARVHALFHREIGSLRMVFNDIGKVLDEIAAGFRAYWIAMVTLAGAAIAALIRALWLKLFPSPVTSATGKLLEKLTSAKLVGVTSIATGTIAALLLKGADTLTTMARKERQFGYVAPTGAARIDFAYAALDVKNHPSFQQPPAPGKLPAGAQNFNWVAPNVEYITP
ncbi:hypothetical protein [Nonomuraea sp. NPDC050786]|uniref:WXG100 family type VII secretion target n=1 Tax=Nonomuraea sp. NPDC050786 TaxID=3154840 RepID=UPI0033D2CFAD